MNTKIIKLVGLYSFLLSVIVMAVGIVGSLVTFHPTDSSWFYHTTDLITCKNLFGVYGSYTACSLFFYLGHAVWTLPLVLLYSIWMAINLIMSRYRFQEEWDRIVGLLLGVIIYAALSQLIFINPYSFCYAGGVVGHWLIGITGRWCSIIVQKIVAVTLLLISVILVSRCAYIPFFAALWRMFCYCADSSKIPARMMRVSMNWALKLFYTIIWLCKKIVSIMTGATLAKMEHSIIEFQADQDVDQQTHDRIYDQFWSGYLIDDASDAKAEQAESLIEPKVEPILSAVISSFEDHDEKCAIVQEQSVDKLIESYQETIVATFEKEHHGYVLPVLPLQKIEQKKLQEHQIFIASQAKLLEEKLGLFDIKGVVVGMHAGPVVTLFEYQPDSKVKVSRILSLEDDLAMALKALSIRIIAPIPGRSVVGFEIANQFRQDVMMSPIVNSLDFLGYKGALPMIFGQDTLGNDIIADLAKMPHLLIAGSTGSGKSVALNVMLVSLLCALKPAELKLVIIDPKRLEFAAYDGIAHLLFPIVTDTKQAIPILKWVVQTMEKRYEIMAKFGVRNLADYKIAAQKNTDMQPMPFIVVIIDELADLMMTAGKAVEDSIARLAQMARAAGIHMIIATQRPSVDVITGMIKVNFPNRVAFKVTSKIDSRTILDVAGAEKLLGRGDMLFLDASKSHLVRVHGAYISDKEIHDIVAQIKKQEKVVYLDLKDHVEQHDLQDLFDGDDEIYQQIVRFIQDLDEISISMLQRRFRIGYNRSARFISILESKGLIMTVDGGKTRRVVK